MGILSAPFFLFNRREDRYGHSLEDGALCAGKGRCEPSNSDFLSSPRADRYVDGGLRIDDTALQLPKKEAVLHISA
jgi:hypothetical protein